jgi:CHAT domain-containing protein/Tfp pilus assembly protein PilF
MGERVRPLASPCCVEWPSRLRVSGVLLVLLSFGVQCPALPPAGVEAAPPRSPQVEAARGAAQEAFQEGEELRKQGTAESLLKAIEKYEEALKHWRAAGDRAGEAITLNNIGGVYDALGEKQKALDYYSQALPLRRAVGDRAGEAVTLNNIGGVYDALGEKQEALDYLNQALPLEQAVGDRAKEAVTLSNIGAVYGALGEKQKALDYLNQALPLRRAVGDPAGEATTLSNIGAVYENLGEKQKALDYLNQVLPLRRAVGDRAQEATTLNNIGGVYNALGEKQKALDYFNQALPLRRAVGDRAQEATTLNNIGLVYDSLGEKQKALDYYVQALPLRRAVGDRAKEATTLNSIGLVYDSLGEKHKALDYYNQALPLTRAVGDRAGEATTLNSVGLVYDSLGEKHKALDYYNQALPLTRAVGDRASEATTLSNIGAVYENLGEKQKALDYLDQARTLARAVGDRAGEATTLGNMGFTKQAQDNLPEARASVEEALKIIESLRTKVTSQELRTSYLSCVHGYYEDDIDILMRLDGKDPTKGYDRQALEVSERGRARSLLETLTEARADIRQGVDPKLLEKERALQQLLDAKSERLTRRENTQEAAALRKELDDLQSQYQDVEAQIRAASPHYAALTQPQPLSVNEIQQQVLDPDTLLLEYALGPRHSYLFAVTPDSLRTYTLPAGQEIESRARDLYALLTHSSALPADQVDEVTAQFSQVVLWPAATQLGYKRLVIVADGALNYIPLGALPAPLGGKAGVGKPPPLVAEHEIVYLPSASTLALLRRDTQGRTPAPKLLAVMADPVFTLEDDRVKTKTIASTGGAGSVGSGRVSDRHPEDIAADLSRSQLTRSVQESGVTRAGGIPRLPFTRQEADGIASLVPTSMRLEDLDFAASKAAATSNALSQYRMVHFATHGLLDSEHPELSGVVLSLVDEKGLPVDGFLRLDDIFNLNLPADLVVLSACQTGLGKEIRGEGLVGLTRGFMYAGAPRVVVSLWSVNDQATAELMVRFYKGMLVDKLRPAAALKAAQVSMWKDPRWSAPYYWAPFVLQGEWK